MYCVTQPAPIPTLLWWAAVDVATAACGPISAESFRSSATGCTFSQASVGKTAASPSRQQASRNGRPSTYVAKPSRSRDRGLPMLEVFHLPLRIAAPYSRRKGVDRPHGTQMSVQGTRAPWAADSCGWQRMPECGGAAPIQHGLGGRGLVESQAPLGSHALVSGISVDAFVLFNEWLTSNPWMPNLMTSRPKWTRPHRSTLSASASEIFAVSRRASLNSNLSSHCSSDATIPGSHAFCVPSRSRLLELRPNSTT